MEARSGAFISYIKISALSDKNCGFFPIGVVRNFNFGPKIQMLIPPTFLSKFQKYSRTKSVFLRGSYGKNLVKKLRPTWAVMVGG